MLHIRPNYMYKKRKKDFLSYDIIETEKSIMSFSKQKNFINLSAKIISVIGEENESQI